jgi:hypothetical protein
MDPFLDPSTFASWAKNPTWGSDPLVEPLLTVASDWIRERRPGIAADDQAAQVVVFEVARDALMAGEFGPYSEFTKTVGHRTRSATISRASIERFITDRHRRMLGIALVAAPRGRFPRGDY